MDIRDYSHFWYSPRFCKESLDENIKANILTGYYGIQIEPCRASISRIGIMRNDAGKSFAVENGPKLMDSLQITDSTLSLFIDGIEYPYDTSTSKGPMGDKEDKFIDNMWRIIESGSLVQRYDINNIRFKGTGTSVRGRLEIAAYPSWFNLIYEVTALDNVKGEVCLSYSLALPYDWNIVEWFNQYSEVRGVTIRSTEGEGISFVIPSVDNNHPDIKISVNKNIVSFTSSSFQLHLCKPWFEGKKGFNVACIPSTSASNVDIKNYLSIKDVNVNITGIDSQTNPDVEYNSEFGSIEIPFGQIDFTLNDNPQQLNRMERYLLTLYNPGDNDISIPVVFKKNRGMLEYVTGYITMLRDPDTGEPTGIPVQLSKNWHSRKEVSMLFDGQWCRNTAIVKVPAGQKVSYEVTTAIQNWGGIPSASVAQLCLIGWGTNGLWIESALGSHGENICFEPEGTQMKDGSMIDDIRPFQVAGMSKSIGKPGEFSKLEKYGWTTNQGGGNFLTWYNRENELQHRNIIRTDFVSYGPNMTHLDFHFTSGLNHEFCCKVSHNLLRTDDMVRIIYRLKYSVEKELEYKRLALFQMGSDSYAAAEPTYASYGNEDGILKETSVSMSYNKYIAGFTNIELTGKEPWAGLTGGKFRKKEPGALGNRGFVIREWNAVVNGQRLLNPYISLYKAKGWPTGAPSPLWELSLNKGSGKLKPGDYIEAAVEFFVLPQYISDYYGVGDYMIELLKNGENSWQPIHRYATINRIYVDMARGELVSSLPLEIRVDSNQWAEFTLSGGFGYIPVFFTGILDNKGYVLEIYEDDKWNKIDQSFHGNDFWQTDKDSETGLYNITYNIKRNSIDKLHGSSKYRFKRK